MRKITVVPIVGSREVFDVFDFEITDNGDLLLSDNKGRAVAAYAPGYWAAVFEDNHA